MTAHTQPIDTTTTQHEVKLIDVKTISLEFKNSRKRIKQDDLESLKASIAKSGLLQPLVVTRTVNGYTLLAGFTRYEAISQLGHSEVAATIIQGNASELFEAHCAENAARSDLSFASKIGMVRRLLTECGDDHMEVAQRLGITKKAMEDYIALTKCSDNVLDALDDNQIKVGHAVILSSFTQTLQNNTLEKLLAEKWTVQYLRERANKARVKLELAKFDQAECASCQHNSDCTSQAELFGETIIKGVCSNTKCFQTKQQAWLDAEAEKQSEQYGTLLEATSVDPKMIRLVKVDVLGDNQYNACQTCQHNIALIDNRLTLPSLGSIREQICNKPACYDEKKAEHAPQEDNTDKASNAASGGKKTVKKGSSKVRKADKNDAPAVASELTVKQKEIADGLLANLIVEINPLEKMRDTTLLSIAYMAFSHLYSSKVTGAVKLEYILNMDDEAIKVALADLLAEFFAKAKDNTDTSTNAPRTVLQQLMFKMGNPNRAIIQSWQPTALTNYPTRAIIVMCEEAGFTAHYDKANGDEAFAKVAKKKGDLLKAIEKNDFDWKDYAPAAYINYFNSKYNIKAA